MMRKASALCAFLVVVMGVLLPLASKGMAQYEPTPTPILQCPVGTALPTPLSLEWSQSCGACLVTPTATNWVGGDFTPAPTSTGMFTPTVSVTITPTITTTPTPAVTPTPIPTNAVAYRRINLGTMYFSKTSQECTWVNTYLDYNWNTDWGTPVGAVWSSVGSGQAIPHFTGSNLFVNMDLDFAGNWTNWCAGNNSNGYYACQEVGLTRSWYSGLFSDISTGSKRSTGRIGYCGEGNSQISVDVIVYGRGQTPTPAPTSTPAVTPTVTPTPASVLDCSDYSYAVLDPAGEYDPGGYIGTLCTVVLPEFSLTVPAYGDFGGVDLEVPEIEICVDWYEFPTATLFGMEFPIEIVILPFVIFALWLIMSL